MLAGELIFRLRYSLWLYFMSDQVFLQVGRVAQFVTIRVGSSNIVLLCSRLQVLWT